MWADNQKNIFPYFITLLCFPTLVHLTFFGFVWQRKSLKTLYNFTVQYYEGQSLFGHSKQVQKPYIIIPDSPINRVTTYCILFHFFYNRNMFSSFSHKQLLQSIVFFFYSVQTKNQKDFKSVCYNLFTLWICRLHEEPVRKQKEKTILKQIVCRGVKVDGCIIIIVMSTLKHKMVDRRRII